MVEPHSEFEPDSTNLSDETEATGTVERRAAPRHPCYVQTEGYELGPHGNPWVATITNISATGVALVMRHRVKPGTVLVIKLQSSNQRMSRPFPIRVMHIKPHTEDTWLLGCAFVRKVREDDLQSLL